MKLRHALSVFASLLPASLTASALEIGAEAPKLAATLDTGESVTLAELYSQGPVLVYFYPKADTPGCTKQACNLRDAFEQLQLDGVKILGVSTDSVDAQRKFREKHRLPFPLAADTDRKLVEAFGVKSLGKLAARQTFLIVEGRVAWRDLNAKPATQAQDAMAALAEIRAGKIQ